MKISIGAIGRLKSGPETELAERYCKRFTDVGRPLGLIFNPITELSEARSGNAAVRKEDEAKRLLAKLPTEARIIALDERGKNPTSDAFARLLERYRDDGCGELAFLIGGADGHGGAVANQATQTLSLGAMTLPHGLARVILLEQLYRAATILAGHPYHRA